MLVRARAAHVPAVAEEQPCAPHPRRAMQRLVIRPEDAWLVGDHPSADVAGAHSAWLAPLWRFTEFWPKPNVKQRGEGRPWASSLSVVVVSRSVGHVSSTVMAMRCRSTRGWTRDRRRA